MEITNAHVERHEALVDKTSGSSYGPVFDPGILSMFQV